MPGESTTIGWSGCDARAVRGHPAPAPGWNGAAHLVQGAWRVPLEGLTIDCGLDDPHPKTRERARARDAPPGARGRAVVIAPAAPADVVDVLLFFHGNNLGWRRRATGEAPRDIARDRLAAQLTALHAEGLPVVAVLPQGTVSGHGGVPRFGPLAADAYIAEALAAAGAHPELAALARARVRDVVVGGHSGGGIDLSHLLLGRGGMRAPSRLRGVAHFDAINFRGAEPADHWRWASALLAEQLAALQALAPEAQGAYLAASCGLVARHTRGSSSPDGYARLYRALRERIDGWFTAQAAAIGACMSGATRDRWRARFQVTLVDTTHEALVREADGLAVALRGLLRGG